MARTDPLSVDRLIERILDGKPVEAPPAGVSSAGAMREFEALQTVSDIARAFRRFDPMPQAASSRALFEWGHLLVLEKVATGGSSEVFRAWDAGLGTHVALKLLRMDAATPRAGDFLREARRLAKLRHHHVLSVYGAATHDGRPGLWCEWIDGNSLARQVSEHGALSCEEAVVLGITLCRALGVVHAAGLLHGDVKPGNVLRERGGRIVLADFGAGGDPAEVNARLRSEATPAWLAPEVLSGALRTPQQDLFALGGLLQFALNGRAPDPTRFGADLVRADVSPALRAVVARARSQNPDERFQDAAEMERALLGCLVPESKRTEPRALWTRWAIAAALVLALLGGLLLSRGMSVPMPLDAELTLLRQRGDLIETMRDGAQVSLGDRLSFSIRANQPFWLYAFNADDKGELHRLFPLKELELTNPLPANRTIDIPGRWQGRPMRFEISSEASAEEFLLVISGAPVSRLESTDTGVGVDEAELRLRGTSQVVPAIADLPGTRLDALASDLAKSDARIRLWRFHLPHQKMLQVPEQR